MGSVLTDYVESMGGRWPHLSRSRDLLKFLITAGLVPVERRRARRLSRRPSKLNRHIGCGSKYLPEAASIVSVHGSDEEIADRIAELARDPALLRRIKDAAWRRRGEALWQTRVREVAAVLGPRHAVSFAAAKPDAQDSSDCNELGR